ncbi:acriflavin resistance protein [Fulvitalea axinellae]|uniref:Acriflavin resistance protein n=1 Tax=Fulvitalea axinellae TaxID=1182444 RepID=A0AAU9CRK9_9BACT|nr:acriflavin resistance protein [Fulvitalea axinellae]
MRKLTELFVKYPFYGKVVMLLLILLGGVTISGMKKSSFPLVPSRNISIQVAYQGASPKEMEEGVTSLVENALRGTPGIKEMTSVSAENIASISVTTLPDYDTDKVLYDIKNAVDGISNFPVNAEKPRVSKVRATSTAMYVDLKGSADLMTLKKYAQKVEDDFLASGIVSQMTISGYPSLEISVEVREDDLQRYGLSLDQVRQAIANNNLDITGGTIRNKREEIKVLSRQRSVEPDDIQEIVILAMPNGQLLKIKDVADVKLMFRETPSGSWVNGERSISLAIRKLNTEDLEDISVFVKDYAEKFNEKHTDAEIIVAFDFADLLQDRLDTLYENGLMGIFLVVISLSLFLSFRLSLWVAWGIPASFLGMFVLAGLVGITINMISLFGMILIIGILVDDGIVIGENIYSHFEAGKSPRQAAIDGTMEVIPAVFTSVTTTIVAFLPLLFMTTKLEMIKDMAIVVILCLSFSLLEGMFILPSHLATPAVLNRKKKDNIFNRTRAKLDKGIFYVRDKVYLPMLSWLLGHKWFSLFIYPAVVIFTIGLVGGRKIEATFFPSVEQDFFSVDLVLKPGTNEKFVKDELVKIEKAIWEVNNEMMEANNDTASYVKYTYVGLGSAFNGNETGTNAGSIFIILTGGDDSPVSSHEIKKKIHEKVGDVPAAYKFAVGASDNWGAPVSISLLGDNFKEIEQASDYLKKELGKIASLYNIIDNNQLGSREIRLSLKPKAYALGFNQVSLMTQVRAGFFGAEAQRLQHGKDEIRIFARYPHDGRQYMGQLDKMRIRTAQGTFPLTELADYHFDRGPVAINRFNGKTEIRVDAYLVNAEEAVLPIIDQINANVLPKMAEKFPDIKCMYQGQQKSSNEDIADLTKFYGIAFLIIVVILVAYFRSYVQAGLILAMIPLGIIGALWGHGIEGHPVSLFSIMGIVALSGTIINDAVVFVSKFNQNLAEGMAFRASVLDAGKSRFRPIMLTTVTTTVGLYPLILETSLQAQFLIPMAISLAYGIFIGTFFILTVLPVLITFANDVNRSLRSLFKGRKLGREEVEPAVIDAQKETLEAL